MAKPTNSILFNLSLLLIIFPSSITSETESLQTYIIQLHPNSLSSPQSKLQWHLSFLNQATSDSVDQSSRLLYSYNSAMEGFSALLSDDEASSLRNRHDVMAVRPDRKVQLHTTYSYKFLGLGNSKGKAQSAWAQSRFGKGSIIGVLDTGVWPESPSFDDTDMGPVPMTWKGSCQEGQNFNASSCNKKLIGAKFFIKGHHVAVAASGIIPEYVSPRDSAGHGTHTSSTAAGSRVTNAGILGNGAGEARGMAPGAHIAVYKVCWFSGCYSSDILAALDTAIGDGVHVLSLSLGGFPVPLYDDTIAIGSFRAMERGISVVCAAGNNGPIVSSVANEAPWITTVGASTLDRRFPAYVRTGNGTYLYGESVYPGQGQAQKQLGLVYVSGANSGSEFCIEGSLPRKLVEGKIVICDRGINGRAAKGEVVKKAGGVAMILANTELNLEEDSVDPHVLPATLIGFYESTRLKSYVNSTKTPTGKILFKGTVLGKARAPAVARFSSRGPSISDPSVIKPDMIAPGVNIIAAWPQNLGPTGLAEDSRRVNFTIMSGTSMACPHVSGITALVRSAHPEWSPAAVKSAIMTSADVTDHYGKPIMDGGFPASPFAMGSGHVNPGKAMNPGLVYDIKPEDYVTHLCSLGYTRSEILTITHRNVSCGQIRGFSLNYPSISVVFKKGVTRTVVRRRLTNVGRPGSVYSVRVHAPDGVKVVVRPRQLVFKSVGQSLSYEVYVALRKGGGASGGESTQGGLAWVDCRERSNVVRSPISVTRMNG